ncbi:MAG TPA: SIMPL domain-containing protein [Pseudonocardiaceae bacterium]
MTEVVTRGTGEFEVAADQAEIRVSFAEHAADRGSAVNLLGQRMAAVEPVLTRDGVVVRQRAVHVGDRWDGRRRAGSTAQQHLVLRVTDLGVLDDLLAGLFSARPDWVDGPQWSLVDETAAVREAQRRAVADARARAEAYAEALGGSLGNLLRLADEGAERPYPMHGARMAAAGMDMAVGRESVQQLGLAPEQVTARVTCVATWALLS